MADPKEHPPSPPTPPKTTENGTPSAHQHEVPNDPSSPQAFKHTLRIWCVFIALCLLSLISAIDATIITTSLPTITDHLGGGASYVWIANSFLFASTIPQPFYGQIANIFGRRNPMLVSIFLFALGSGVAGGATSPAMLIASRTVQGLGTGGLYVLSDIIICDMIPPRHRGPYLSAVLSTAAIGTTIGPIIGGALALRDWRWVFWINLPISAIGLAAILLFLNVQYTRSPTWLHALGRVDFLGNAIFIPSMVAIFFGLIMGGTRDYPWSSWKVILPLVLGAVGWVVFHIHQASPRICKEPSTPPHLFKHRTSATGFVLIFLAGVILQAVNYFLPLYFQAVKRTSPLTSGVYFLPFALAIIPFGGLAGLSLSKTGLYRPLHWVGFVMSAIGVGLFSLLDEESSNAAWIGYQVVASGGTGIIFTATLPSTLAPLEEKDVGVATGTYSFVRSFGLVWGVTLASIVFNGRFNSGLERDVGDAGVRGMLADGAAYAYAASPFGSGGMDSLDERTRGEIIGVYVDALRVMWLVIVGVSCLGFLATFVEKHVDLRKEHETEFGLGGDKSETEGSGVREAEEGVGGDDEPPSRI